MAVEELTLESVVVGGQPLLRPFLERLQLRELLAEALGPVDRRRLRILHGHHKDHRPDLKQMVWSRTVSADGAVPVHYNVYDGNRTDDQLHVDTWEALRRVVGSPDFI